MSSNFDYLIKIMLIGDSNVGKSSLMIKFTDDIFDIEGCPTIGIDFKIKTVQLCNMKIKIQILDTAGQERFRSITNSHYRNAMGIILVYDVSNEESFKNIESWLNNIDKFTTEPINKILVGNKIDSDKKIISSEQGKEMADKYNLTFYETSVKDDINVANIFHELSLKIIERLKMSKPVIDEKKVLINEASIPVKNKKCC